MCVISEKNASQRYNICIYNIMMEALQSMMEEKQENTNGKKKQQVVSFREFRNDSEFSLCKVYTTYVWLLRFKNLEQQLAR